MKIIIKSGGMPFPIARPFITELENRIDNNYYTTTSQVQKSVYFKKANKMQTKT